MSCSGIYSPSNSCLAPCDYAPCVLAIFRAHVGDFTDPPTWSDSRALEILIAAAYQVSNEVSCVASPTINICTGDFSSNPFLYPQFVNLWVLKAACIVDQGSVRLRALQDGVRAVCGPAMLEVKSGGTSTYQLLFENGACAAYKDLVENLCFRNPIQSASNCVQVVGTFVSEYYSTCRGYAGERC